MSAVLAALIVANFLLTSWGLFLAHQRTKMQREDMHYKREKRQREHGKHASGSRSHERITGSGAHASDRRS